MKMIISVVALVLLCGCSPTQSPESKEALSQFLSQSVQQYMQVLSSGDINKMNTEFPALLMKWEGIKNQLPTDEVQNVNNALSLHSLFLLYNEFNNTNIDALNPDDRKTRYKEFGDRRTEFRNNISEKYWEKLSVILVAPTYNEDNVIALNELRTNEAWGMFAKPQGLGGVVYANMNELIQTLKPLSQ